MQNPLQISFRGMDPSPAVEDRIRDRAERLDRFHPRITSCNVVVEAPHKQHQHGNLFEVRIHLRVPGNELVVNREGPKDHAHEDVYVAVRDAFHAAERMLEDHVRRRDHRKKVHEAPPQGRVTRLFAQDGYGFIETPDELEVYFHANSVVDGSLQDLSVGDEVRVEYVEQESDKGPQATTVRVLRQRSAG